MKIKEWFKNKKSQLVIIVTLLAVLILIIIFSKVLIKKVPIDWQDKHYESYIGIYSGVIAGICALVGGIFTLFGVLVDKQIERKKAQDELISHNVPEIYIPIKFDDYSAIHVVLTSVNIKIDSSPIRKQKLVLKNSYKNSFKIVDIKINDDEYKMNMQKLFINEGDLFSFHFNSSNKVNTVTLILESIEKTRYFCNIIYENYKPNSIEINMLPKEKSLKKVK